MSLLLMAARARANHIISVPSVAFTDYVDTLSPVAHWRMDDVAGSTSLVDRITGAPAALTGTAGSNYLLQRPGMLAGDSDTAVQFAGGRASSGSDAKWALGAGDFSAFCIAKWTQGGFNSIGGIRDGSTNILILFTVNRTAVGQVGAEGWNWENQKLLASDKAYNDGNPHALGVTYEAATNTMRLYVDGALKVTQVQTGSFSRPTASTMFVNIAQNFSSQFFQGTLDEIVLFNSKLTDTDMAGLAAYVAKN